MFYKLTYGFPSPYMAKNCPNVYNLLRDRNTRNSYYVRPCWVKHNCWRNWRVKSDPNPPLASILFTRPHRLNITRRGRAHIHSFHLLLNLFYYLSDFSIIPFFHGRSLCSSYPFNPCHKINKNFYVDSPSSLTRGSTASYRIPSKVTHFKFLYYSLKTFPFNCGGYYQPLLLSEHLRLNKDRKILTFSNTL